MWPSSLAPLVLCCAASTLAWSAPRRGAAMRPSRAAASAPEHDGWVFTGRFIFAPELVRAPESAVVPEGVSVLSLFGWTLGGIVALEYDESPVGRYFELVRMAAVVTKNGALGQWGEKLFVSNAEAEAACEDIWEVPAEAIPLTFEDAGDELTLTGDGSNYELSGWGRARGAGRFRSPALPVLWTPQIKALWAPLKLPSAIPVTLNLHNLALSATSLSVRSFADARPDPDRRRKDLGFCLAADGLRIAIAPALGDRL